MKYGHIEDLDPIDFTLPDDHPGNIDVLGGVKSGSPLKLYAGCPVFSDRSYVGPVYPKGTSSKNYLKAYSEQFNTVEVNSFRYGIPSFDKLEVWRDTVGDDFRFSMKVQDRVTYQKDISGLQAAEQMDRFLEVYDFFGKKAGVPYMLLPAYYREERLKHLVDFIYQLPEDFKMALEFRGLEGLNDPDVIGAMLERDMPLVITDTPGRRDMLHMRLTSKTAFIRMAAGRLHESDHTRTSDWADRIAYWYENGLEEVYFFFHQMAPYKYMAAENVRELQQELIKRSVPLDTVVPKDLRTGSVA